MLRLIMEEGKGVDKLRAGGMDMDMVMVMGEGRVTEVQVKAEGRFMEATGQDMAMEEAIDEARKVHELHEEQAPGHESYQVRASTYEIESAGALFARGKCICLERRCERLLGQVK